MLIVVSKAGPLVVVSQSMCVLSGTPGCGPLHRLKRI